MVVVVVAQNVECGRTSARGTFLCQSVAMYVRKNANAELVDQLNTDCYGNIS